MAGTTYPGTIVGADGAIQMPNSTGSVGQSLRLSATTGLFEWYTGLGGSTGNVDNRILRADGTGGATVQAGAAATLEDDGKINITGTGEQLRLSYDALNYAAFTVSSDKALTIGNSYPNQIKQLIVQYYDAGGHASNGLKIANVGTGAAILLHAITGSPNSLYLSDAAGSPGGLTVGTLTNPYDGSILANDTGKWYFSTSKLGIGTPSPGAQVHVTVAASGTIGQIVRGASSQTANLTEWQNSAGTVLAAITASGSITLCIKTIATLPSAASSSGERYQVSDSATVANRIAFSNGTAWYYEGTAVAV